MPSDMHNLIMAKDRDLVFSLFDIASAQLAMVPFGIPQYVQCMLYGDTCVPHCVPIIFADNASCQFTIVPLDGFPTFDRNYPSFPS